MTLIDPATDQYLSRLCHEEPTAGAIAATCQTFSRGIKELAKGAEDGERPAAAGEDDEGQEERRGAGVGRVGAGGEQGGVREVHRAEVPAARRRRRREAVAEGAPAGRRGHRRRHRAARAGSSAQADHIYSEVLNEFTHGKQESVSKSEFQRVLSDILLGMAAGLKRDPIVILRINGEDLTEFVDSPRYEPEVVAIFSQVKSGNAPLRQCLLAALRQLTVDHGMPPASDSLVVENIIQPALQELPADQLDQAVSQEVFFQEFKKFLGIIIRRLQEHPVIVAHTENTFDGSGIRRVLSNKFEFDKLLDSVWRDVPKEHKDKTSKEYLRVALDRMADSASLPPYGAVDQVDAVVNEAFKMAKADDGKAVDEAEFKKLLTEILGAVMLQLDGNPISVSTNSVLHEPMSTSSTLLSPSPPSPMVSSPSE